MTLGGNVGVERVDDLGEVGAARCAVHHGDPVQEERRREAAEDEVLDAAFLALDPLAMAGGHHVHRDRQDLETEEQHDQIVRRTHHHATDRGQQIQRVDLGTLEVLAPQIVVGDEGDQHHGDGDRDGDDHREHVEAQRAADQGRCAVVGDVVPQEEAQDHRCQPGGSGEQRVDVPRPSRYQRADHEQHHRRAEQHQHRAEREPIDGRPDQGRIGGDHGAIPIGCGST